MTLLNTDFKAAAAADFEAMVALRRAIHADPELGLQCTRTTAKLKAALAGLPLEIRDSGSTSGFVAILRGAQPGRTVLLRGDANDRLQNQVVFVSIVRRTASASIQASIRTSLVSASWTTAGSNPRSSNTRSSGFTERVSTDRGR